jgi:hypothetical protein
LNPETLSSSYNSTFAHDVSLIGIVHDDLHGNRLHRFFDDVTQHGIAGLAAVSEANEVKQ